MKGGGGFGTRKTDKLTNRRTPNKMHLLHEANAAYQSGRLQQAQTLLGKLVEQQPNHCDALHLLAMVHCRIGSARSALPLVSKAVRLRPGDAGLLNSFGLILYQCGEYVEAERILRQALALEPAHPEALLNLGNTLRSLKRPTEAAAALQQALILRPRYALAHYNLGNVLVDLGQFSEAALQFRSALAIDPQLVAAFTGLGYALSESGRFLEALACYERAVQLEADNAQAHNNRSLVYLLLGRWELAWPEHEWRWCTPSMAVDQRSFTCPRWDGSSLQGKTLLLYAEQGFGDTLQFVRYAALLHSQGANIVLECQAPLQRLLEGCPDVGQVCVRDEELPNFDVHLPLMSVPHLLGTQVETVPAQVPYLQAPPLCRLSAEVQAELERPDLLRVGIVWSPKLERPVDHKRYCPLRWFEPILQREGVRFFSLYKGSQTADLLPYGDLLVDVGSCLTDFADTAWAIDRLDLVITVDTSVAHLSGALAKPTWVLLPFVPDWRWLLGREDSPWYPTVRLFRQSAPGDWQSVSERLAQSFEQFSKEMPALGHRRHSGQGHQQ